MIRAVKGTLALAGLAGLYLLLRWITAGSISGLRTYDLDSLTVLAVGTVAWIAYGWLVLAVVLTALEQIPGAVGALAGAVAGRITTKTARALLRSGLGVAAVTPLTVGAAHASPGDTAHVSQWTQPSSTTLSTDYRATDYRATEPRSTVQLGGTDTSFRATEPASTVEIGGTETALHRTSADSTAPRQRSNDYRATEPRSAVELGGSKSAPQTPQTQSDYRATEPPSQVRLTNLTPGTPARPTTPTTPSTPTPTTSTPTPTPTPTKPITSTPNHPAGHGNPTTGRPSAERKATDRPAASSGPVDTGAGQKGGNDLPAGGRARVGVPDRPTAGAPTRYTNLRPSVPVRVVVRKGDSLWSIAARELGPRATADAIAARWPDWYATNRQVIGNDPDLILPGQVLRIPPAPTGDHLTPHPEEQ
ncbi:LysM domain-containing protein [Kribbella pratensis]|uniref:LysM domain-containing protein n=2 Tax=Kribbella pratensis TaxID=2512112 RepID=A0ABY2FQU0_9ACTN|nr:LysM domain-containing protein [Kribbella pratensis]